MGTSASSKGSSDLREDARLAAPGPVGGAVAGLGPTSPACDTRPLPRRRSTAESSTPPGPECTAAVEGPNGTFVPHVSWGMGGGAMPAAALDSANRSRAAFSSSLLSAASSARRSRSFRAFFSSIWACRARWSSSRCSACCRAFSAPCADSEFALTRRWPVVAAWMGGRCSASGE